METVDLISIVWCWVFGVWCCIVQALESVDSLAAVWQMGKCQYIYLLGTDVAISGVKRIRNMQQVGTMEASRSRRRKLIVKNLKMPETSTATLRPV